MEDAPLNPALDLVVLVSGAGSNLAALMAASEGGAPFSVVAVGADREGTGGVARAHDAGIPTFVTPVPDYPDRESWDVALADDIGAHRPGLVVSAGFMKILGPSVLARFDVINTHPALLPSFPGAHAVRDALAYGVRVTGCTCHWVDAGVDTGPIIDQRSVRVRDGDTEDALHERIKIEEREMLVGAVTSLAMGRITPPRGGPVSSVD